MSPDGITRAMRIWTALGRLISVDLVRIAGFDPDQVDVMAAVTFELVGPRVPQIELCEVN